LPAFNYIYSYLDTLGWMNKVLRNLSRFLILLLTPAVAWLFINATVNRHSHLLLDGYIISHAHPYDKTPAEPGPLASHHHSGKELFLLSLISDPAATTTILFILILVLLAIMELLRYFYHISTPIRSHYQVRNYHAPPAC
jgi:hypothetical protein